MKELDFPLPVSCTSREVVQTVVSLLGDGVAIRDDQRLDLQIAEGVTVLLDFAEQVGSGIRRFHDRFYVYTGKFWLECPAANLAKEMSIAMVRLGLDETVAISYKTVEKVEKQLLVASLVWDEPKNKDTKINCSNYTVLIKADKEIELCAHKRDDHFTYCLPYDFDLEAKSPLFDSFLEKVLPIKEDREIALESIGAAFIGNLKLEKMVVMLGTGANGKSVFADVMQAVLGDGNVSHYSLDLLADEKIIDTLDSKLLNYASEIGRGISADQLKRLASREPIIGRGLYKSPRVVRDYCRFVFNANTLPYGQSGDAYARRFIIVPWDYTVPVDERDAKLADKIIAGELSGILNKVIRAAYRLIQNERYTQSESTKKALQEYQLQSDSVLEWIEESCLVPTDERQSTSDIYERYKGYCAGAGRKPVSKIAFGRRMDSLGFERKKSQGVRYFLIGTNSNTVTVDEIAPF